jgi:amidase
MSGIKEFEKYDALGLAGLVKRKEVKPFELVEETINRIEEVNPKLNAVIIPMYEEARKVAKKPLPDGVFTGVPFLIKDLVTTYAGAPFTKGCKGLKNYVANEDSELMKRYKAAGVVTVGKTNTPEFGLMLWSNSFTMGCGTYFRRFKRGICCSSGRRHCSNSLCR